jgi:hypothetical protein
MGLLPLRIHGESILQRLLPLSARAYAIRLALASRLGLRLARHHIDFDLNDGASSAHTRLSTRVWPD